MKAVERQVPGIWISRARARAEEGEGRSPPGLGKMEQILLLRTHHPAGQVSGHL